MATVALLSHRGGNIGHDFMAAGFESVVRQTFGENVQIAHFEQHQPFSIYPPWHPLKVLDRVPYRHLRWIKRMMSTRICSNYFWRQAARIKVDVAIGCGGPNIVSGAARSVEMRLMFHHLTGAFQSQGVPVIDAAVGACFPLERLPSQIDDPADVEFYCRLFEHCERSTVRDRLAQRLWAGLGRDAELIPCAAIVSGRVLAQLGGAPRKEYILINFQKRGANEDWGQQVDTAVWYETVRNLVKSLQKRHQVVFVCHSDTELALASNGFPDCNAFYPRSVAEYARLAMGAKVTLASRIHASIPMAGAGIPGISIGTDSRLGAIDMIGLPTYFVKHANADIIESQLEELIQRNVMEAERLIALRESTALSYKNLILETVGART